MVVLLQKATRKSRERSPRYARYARSRVRYDRRRTARPDKYAAIGYTNGLMTSVNTYLAATADSSYQVMNEAIAYNGDSQVTDLTYTDMAGGESSGMLAGYLYVYDPDGQVEKLYSYNDAEGSPDPSDYATWALASYVYTADQQVGGVDGSGGSYYSGGVQVSYTNWANSPTTDNSISVDPNGNNTAGTVSAGNRITFDGTYTYSYDAEGNRTAKWINNSGGPETSPQSGDTDITLYGWDNRNRMTSLKHYAAYGDDPDLDINYSYLCPGQVAGRKFSRLSGSGVRVALAV